MYVVAEYLEGLRISTTDCDTVEAACQRVTNASGLGIDCEVWVMVDSVRGGVLEWMTTNPNATRVCMADVPRYCDARDVMRHLAFTPVVVPA